MKNDHLHHSKMQREHQRPVDVPQTLHALVEVGKPALRQQHPASQIYEMLVRREAPCEGTVREALLAQTESDTLWMASLIIRSMRRNDV